jgi:hypothetical protein
MFPNVYGFHWTPWHVTFLAVFFTIAGVIATTLVLAWRRAARDLRQNRQHAIRWHETFEDMPERDRVCRHQLTGEFKQRTCDRAFACDRCETHAALLERSPLTQAGVDENPFGLPFPADRLYHRGHTWVRREIDGTVTIGLDALGERAIGKDVDVSLPSSGTLLETNGVAWRVRKQHFEAHVLAPLSGEVIETGGPGAAFYLRVKPALPLSTRHLLTPAEVKPWLLRELERLQIMLPPVSEMPSLADGGVPVDDLPAACPTANWDVVWGRMFMDA